MTTSSSPRKLAKIDDFFELDKFQLAVLLFNEFLIFTMCSNVVFNIFGTASPRLVGCDELIYNGTKAEICEQYRAHDGCKSPVLEYEFLSTTVEFTQLCGKHEETWLDTIVGPLGITNKPKLSTTSQMVGIMVGSAIAGQLSDSYGRKKISLCFLILMVIFSSISSFSPSMDVFIIFRFFIGVGCGGLTTVVVILVVELLPAAHRLWLCTVITWAPNYILFSIVAYLTGNWRALSRACNVVGVGACLICAFIIPESPKFLIQKGKREEAIKAMEYINKWKSPTYKFSSEEIKSVVDAGCDAACKGRLKAKKYNFVHLYSTATLAIRTVVVSVMMFSLSYVTYGLIFNLDVIKGSVYMNTAFSGGLRWLVGATVAVVDTFGGKHVGRRRLHFVTMSIIMVCMGATFVIKVSGLEEDFEGTVRALTLFAFGTTGCMFLQYALVTSELFPTPIRNLANANTNIFGRIGNVLGPLVFNMSLPLAGAPYLLMSILSATSVILFLVFIPETKGLPLPSEMPAKKSKSDLQGEEKLLSKA